MTKETISVAQKTEILASLIGDNFLRLAKALRELKDEAPDLFLNVVDLIGLSRRKAYALVRISRQFEELGVSEERLYFIGWSKLQIIGRYVTPDNSDDLLQLAEQNTTHDLEVLLRGETPVEDAKIVQFYLSPDDYKLLRVALVARGASLNGGGLIKKETALMMLLKQSQGQP